MKLLTPVPRSLVRRGQFDALKFLAQLPCHIQKTYESTTRYYGRYSSRRRGEGVWACRDGRSTPLHGTFYRIRPPTAEDRTLSAQASLSAECE